MESTTFRRKRVMNRKRDVALQLVVEEMEDRILLASVTASNGVVSIAGDQGAIGTADVQSMVSAAAIPDPTIFIPVVHGNDGDTVSVPIELTVTAAGGITVSGFQVAIAYDSSEFSVSSVAQPGPMFSAALGFSGLLSFPAPGELIYNASSGTGTGNIPFNTTTPLFSLSFTVASDAPTGPSGINLLRNISTTATAIFDNNLDELILTPAPTNAPTDSVDGLFQVGPAALVSIALSPASPSVAKGLTQQFTATGTYTDRSSAVVTNQVTWASGTTSVATISNTSGSQGLASTLATGTTAITAAFSGITSPSDTLTVTAASDRRLDRRLGRPRRQRQLEQPRKLGLGRAPNHGGNSLFYRLGFAILDRERRHILLDRQLERRQHVGRLRRCESASDHLRKSDPGQRLARWQRNRLGRR